MSIVQEAGMARIRYRSQAAPGNFAALQADYFEAGAAKVRLEDEAIVACPENDAVKLVWLMRSHNPSASFDS
jgi:hypothetical protein